MYHGTTRGADNVYLTDSQALSPLNVKFEIISCFQNIEALVVRKIV